MCVRAACRLQELRTVAEKLWPLVLFVASVQYSNARLLVKTMVRVDFDEQIASHLDDRDREQPPVSQVHGLLMKHQRELSELVEHMGWPSNDRAGKANT